jgi:hypothetical protein
MTILGLMGEPADHNSDRDRSPFCEERLNAVLAPRAAIERARGSIMSVYQIDADTALTLLASRARSTGVNLSRLAEQILDDFLALPPRERTDLQAACDQILISVGERARRRR